MSIEKVLNYDSSTVMGLANVDEGRGGEITTALDAGVNAFLKDDACDTTKDLWKSMIATLGPVNVSGENEYFLCGFLFSSVYSRLTQKQKSTHEAMEAMMRMISDGRAG